MRDLADAAFKMVRDQQMRQMQHRAEDQAEERVLDALLPEPTAGFNADSDRNSSTRQLFRKKLREGELDDKEIDIEVSSTPVGVEIMAPPGMEEMTNQLQNLFSNLGQGRTRRNRLKVKDALRRVQEEEAAKLINEDEVKGAALEAVEQTGIVFLDEIDKVAKRGETSGTDVSREGVQRDLLPLIEGCTVSTKHGTVRTDHILFIASGAFHLSKPADLIPELQGRLPIRVELASLGPKEFERILIEPDHSLTAQYSALLGTEDVALNFTADGIRTIAELAWQVNERTENIGARRLHTVMERLLEAASFDASEQAGSRLEIDADYVNQALAGLVADQDLSQYIL